MARSQSLRSYPDARTIILQQAQSNIAAYVARGSPYTRRLCQVRGPAHKVNGCQLKLEREQQPAFRWKKTTRQAFLKIVSTQSRRKKFLGTILHAAAIRPQLWIPRRLCIMDGQWSYTADFTSSHNSESIAF